jgi:hypothetical protein
MKVLNLNNLTFFSMCICLVLLSSACKKDDAEIPNPQNDSSLVLTDNYLKINDNYFRVSNANNTIGSAENNNIIRELELTHESGNEETYVAIEYSTQNGIVVGQFNYENDCSLFSNENYTPNIIYCDGFGGEAERGDLEDWFDFGDYENNSGTLTITQTGGNTYSIIFNGVLGNGKTVSIKYNGTM